MLELGLDFKNVGITRIRAIYEIISQMDLFHRKKAALPVRIVADRTDRWLGGRGWSRRTICISRPFVDLSRYEALFSLGACSM